MNVVSILGLILILASSTIHARLAERSDVKFEQLDQLMQFEIESDGTYSVTEANTIILTQEASKELFSLHKVQYQSGRESVEVLEAYVETDGKRIPVDKDKIVDKAVTNNAQGFDSSREISISFPALKMGSQVFLKTLKKVHKVAVPGHFSFEGHLGAAAYEHNSKIIFTSKIPLLYELVDPYKVLSAREEKVSEGKIQITVEQKRPFMRFQVEEYSILTRDELTSVRVGSEKNLDKVRDYLKTKFEERIGGNLPEQAKKWVEEAKLLETVNEKVNFLVARQVDHFNYIGDWRTIEGAYIPRPIEEIWQTRQGDCKDFSIILTQLLRAMGLNASPAIVKRSSFYEAYQATTELKVPGLMDFNHAIVNLNIDGVDYWLDPTNSSSFDLNVRQDIAGKSALVLAERKNSFVKIPMPKSSLTSQNISKEYNFQNAEEADVKAEVLVTGESALSFTNLEKKLTKNKIKEAITRLITNGESTGEVSFSEFDLTSALFQDVKFKLEYKGVRLGQVLQGERVMSLPDPLLGQTLRLNTDKYIGSLILGMPQTMSRTIKYKGISAVGRFPQGCNINTDWLAATRKYSLTDEGVELVEVVDIKEGVVSKTEFKKTDFEKLQIDYADCFFGKSFSYIFGAGKHSTTTANLAKLFIDLPLEERVQKRKDIAREVLQATGRKRIVSYNEQEAMILLQMNIQEAPKDESSYALLANIITDLGYMNGNRWTTESLSAALRVLTIGQQQIPEGISLALNIGIVMGQSGQKDKAKAILHEVQSKHRLVSYSHYSLAANLARRINDYKLATDYFKMALTLAESDDQRSATNFNLAVLSSNQNDLEGCVKYYDETTRIDPGYVWAHLNVVNCHLKLKNYDLAVRSGEQSYALSSSGMSANNYERALSARASAKISENKIDEAILDFKRAIEVRPKDETYLNLAKAYASKSDLKSAQASVEAGIRYLEKNIPKYYADAANLLKNDEAQYLLYMNKSAETSTTVSRKMWVFYNILFVMNEKGKLHEVMDVAQKSLAMGKAHLADFPEDAKVHVEMGKVYFFLSKELDDLKQLELAEEHFQKAVKEKSDLKSANSALSHVQNINASLGRQPSSLWWKAKAKAHKVLQEKFDYKLLDW